MPIDTSIYANALRPAPSVMDDLNQYAQRDIQQGQLAQNRLALASGQQKLDEYTREVTEKNALRDALSSGQIDLSTPEGMTKGFAVAPTQFGPIAKAAQDRMTSQALAAKDQGSAAESQQKVRDQAFAHFQNVLGTVETPQQAAAFITANFQDPIVGPMLAQRGSLQDSIAHLQQVTQTPEGFQQWKANAALGIQKMAELAKTQQVDSGGTTSTQIVQPATGQVQTVASVQNTPKPDTLANNATSRANVATQQAGESKRAELSRKTQLQVAGMDQSGNYMVPTVAGDPGAAPGQPAKSPLQGLVDAVGSYQVPESTAFSRMTAPAKAAVLAAVKQQYPDYDPMSYTERQAGIRAFSPAGKSGQAVKSFNVGLAHLDTLGDLATALDNGNNQTVNAVANKISAWSGGTAPTNFDAAKNIVMDEVVKAVVGGGGGVGDREKAQAIVDAAKSPQQLAGAIKTVKSLMGGQLVGLEQSYTASTGKKDFRTKYLVPEAQSAIGSLTQGGSGAPAAPNAATAPIFDAAAIAAELKRRAAAGGH